MYAQDIELSIEGTSPQSSKFIDSLSHKTTFSDTQSLKLYLKDFQNQLYRLGFIENQLIELNNDSKKIYNASFELNKKYTHLKVFGEKAVLILSGITPKPELDNQFYIELPFLELETTLKNISNQLSAKSYPFSKVKLSKIINPANGVVIAYLNVDKGKSRRIQSVTIKGYEEFPKGFIKHYLNIKTNQDLNIDQLNAKTQTLDQLNFAKLISPPEVLFTQDSTIVYLSLSKTNSNTFDGFLGFGSNANTGAVEFDGYADLRLINNLNAGETFLINYKSDENKQKTFNTSLELPYVFNSPLGIELGLTIFKKDSLFSTTEQRFKLLYPITPQHLLKLGVNTSQSTTLTETQTSTAQDYKNEFYTFSYHHQKPNFQDRLYPIKRQLHLQLSGGSRTLDQITSNQYAYNLKAQIQLNLNPRNSIYTRLDLQGLESETYVFNELIRFGGINSIRGFEENSIYANWVGVFNSEYRYRLNSNLYIHTIIDAAYYEAPTISGEKLYGFGFGFGLLTNSGLLRFNYANGKNNHQPFKLSDSKIHLSLTTRF
jgi:outer membrane protein assembly factor BamA